MKRLIQSLQRFSATSTEHVELLGGLTLRDLGFYVSDAAAVRFMADRRYPIAQHAFQLECALHQQRFSAAAAPVTPMLWKSSPADAVGCSTLYQDEVVTLCWFVLPPGRVLPLHDHPGMRVWQRVMHGQLHVCSIAVADETRSGGASGVVLFDGEVGGVGDAVAAAAVQQIACNSGGVLHEIRNVDATRPALLVDVISPPYNQVLSNIPCGYYTAEPADGRTPLSPAPVADCGVRHPFAAGDAVLLHHRGDYGGPAMDAYVHLE
ncbi:hypothetical protein NESM_000203600 [Novymonas esmeraldas]|uniref:Uncharacterized protein n=1 Tax=Novymonas esmeraldas TaxID=1808958 RepID=A0AAW0F6Z9_9TRYP